jgi:asparagine synthase (glutamine-hydrolysing)
MCGLAGFLDPRRRGDPAAYEAIVRRMADRVAHRGPDDAGAWCDGAAGIALGFRRLAILDLTAAGHQPMASAAGDHIIIFNGEIYNHRALRAELDAQAVTAWRGHSDTETLVEAIARWGFERTLEKLNGMFAIALWDRRKRRLSLARDRLGEKPVYWGWRDGVLLFASELKALAAHPQWRGTLDRGALGLFLAHGFVPGPWTAYEGIRKLPPGTVVSIAATGEESPVRAFWSARDVAAQMAARPFAGGLAAAVEALEALVDDAVAMRMEADVPVGAFLSGGIDSSVVVAAMQRARPGAVRSFSIGFPGTRYDEAPFAEAVARHLGTDHTTMAVSEAECLEVLPRLPQIYDEPFADPSEIPTAVLCALTRSRVTVSLSGDGGDEFFGGYDRYARAAKAWQRLSRQHAVLGMVSRETVRMLTGSNRPLVRRWRKMAEASAHRTPMSLYRDQVTRWRPGDALSTHGARPHTDFDEDLPQALPSLEQNLMLLDAVTYLPDDLLVKMDRASMAVALEARAPLLDHRIAELAWSLSPGLMIDGGPKRVLREALYRRVPQDLVDRPKQGFEPPLGRWLRDGLRDWADDLLSPARLRRSGFVDPDVVGSRWREHRRGRRNWGLALWTVLVLEQWLEGAFPAARTPVETPPSPSSG